MTLLVLLGAGSGLCWGVADFFGGLQSRRLPALAVAFWSQVAGALALLAVLLVRGEAPVPPSVAWGLGAGIFGGIGLVLFYRALAVGVVSIVAPVAASGAVVPVFVGLALGEAPGALAGIGILAAIGGVVLVSARGEDAAQEAGAFRLALALALGAALGFGLFFVFLDQGSAVPGASPLWTVAGARLSSLPTLLAIIAAGPRSAPWPGRRIVPIAAIGVLDTVANALFAYASTQGNLGIVATLGSLYPVATVLLGRLILDERLSRVQGAGVALALGGIALLSAP